MAYAVSVAITVIPKHWAAFLPMVLANAKASSQSEAGCQRFDVCTDPDQPHQVYLYELYDDQAAFEAHLASEHFAAFDTATAQMTADKDVRMFRSVVS